MPPHRLSDRSRFFRDYEVLLTVGIWAFAIGGLGFVLGFSGGSAIRRTLAADGALLGLVCAVIHLSVRATVQRRGKS